MRYTFRQLVALSIIFFALTCYAEPSVETQNSTDVAPNIDLKDVSASTPAIENTLTTPQTIVDESGESRPQNTDFHLLGKTVKPATATRLAWKPSTTIAGLATSTPVLVINGGKPGKTLCLTAATHGDELNGIEIVRRVIYDIHPGDLAGQIIGVPIVNIQGFQRGSRYLPDRRDLNRYFPGDPNGSMASRIAHSLFSEIISHCDMLIDIHTGSLKRTNLPQIRADMRNRKVAAFTEGFDDMAVVHSSGNDGMLRVAAIKSGVIAVTLEVGESSRIQEHQVISAVKSINSLLERENMYSRFFSWGDPEPVYYRSTWIRAEKGGILFSQVSLGAEVSEGDLLGIVTDPITNEQSKIVSSLNGRVIGMAVNQVVMPGFAAYHIGIEASEEMLTEEPEPNTEDNIELSPEE